MIFGSELFLPKEREKMSHGMFIKRNFREKKSIVSKVC